MKKLFLLFCLFNLFFLSKENYANVYASGLKISDDTVSSYQNAPNTWDKNFANGGVKIWFIINEAGGGPNSISANITIKQGSTVIRILQITNPAAGVNSKIWDGFNGIGVPVPIGTYTFEVYVLDNVGHSSFDSLWVAGAYYQGPDPDGQTTYGYRGTTSIYDQNALTFGNIYVARGTSLTTSINGFYEFRGDGSFQKKIGTTPVWPTSCPTEIKSVGVNIVGLAGYGFTGSGYIKSINSVTGNFADSSLLGNINFRDLAIRIVGNDTIYYSCRSAASGVLPSIVKKTGFFGDTSTYINFTPYILTGNNGYMKAIVFDDEGNCYVAFGNSSALRKKIFKFNSSGNFVWGDSLDGTNWGSLTGAYLSSLAIYRGSNLTSASDDKIYALVYGGTTSSTNSGIYSLALNGSSITKLLTPPGISSSATAQIISTDPAGNVIWSNGGLQERIVVYSPASGINNFTTKAASALDIIVTNPVPVELTSFNSEVVGNNVHLYWSTATETNNKGFEIQKALRNSENTINDWTTIAFINGKGTTTEKQNYSFVDNKINSGKILYRLKQIDFDGSFSFSNEIEIDVYLIKEFSLEQNYPNPFNPFTTINYNLPKDAKVKLELYSLTGELINTLLNEFKTAGKYSLKFNGSNLPSGTYIYKLTAGEINVTRKMTLLK